MCFAGVLRRLLDSGISWISGAGGLKFAPPALKSLNGSVEMMDPTAEFNRVRQSASCAGSLMTIILTAPQPVFQ